MMGMASNCCRALTCVTTSVLCELGLVWATK